ncbi:hypothetical protein NNO07_06850 [Pseudomonas resinovorans]|uniref:Lipoprotein n=1 Tax=Metapseudomonas resinovorans TaxID=53412 RepID=A0ABT4Y1R1_METRE|nr:hypothetical protein [Pseudomonas resinovorans]MDA8482782.1 hypothetical protein [Pseudomonas resinovorans]
MFGIPTRPSFARHPLLNGVLVSCLLLAGCAGFRSGVESGAIIDGQEADERGRVQLADVALTLDLQNQIQQNDFQVILFVVPVMYDPIDKPRYNEKDDTRLLLEIQPATADYRFRPERVVLTVDGRPLPLAKVSLIMVRDPNQFPLDGLQAIDQTPAGLDYRMTVPQRSWQFILKFAAPVPQPSSDIQLDLSRALERPGKPPLPPIRFRSRPWKQGYT